MTRRLHRSKNPLPAKGYDINKCYRNTGKVQVLQPTMAGFDSMGKEEWRLTKHLYPAGTVYRLDGREFTILERATAQELL
jgi:hypothetical protein